MLVLDDVWNEYHEKWEGLKEAFRCGANGSAVMVTTRIEKVALMMTTPIFHLGCLSNADSWSLFKQRSFRMGKSKDYPNLEELGKEIVKKCGGVPLAIKALGSVEGFYCLTHSDLFLDIHDTAVYQKRSRFSFPSKEPQQDS